MRERFRYRKHYESRVRWEALVIYFVATALCAAVIYYISNLQKSVLNQRVNIYKNEKVLDLTNDLIKKVNETQSDAQLYSFSGKQKHLLDFKNNLKTVSSIKDSIIFYSNNDEKNKAILNDIVSLLKRKENIIKRITHQYDLFNPYDEIYKLITNYKPEKKTKIVAVTKQDTIVHKAEKKSFFQRVFSSDTPRDSIILVSTTTFDTITDESDDSIDIMKDIKL